MKRILSAVILALFVALVPTGAFAQEASARYGTGSFTVNSLTLPAQFGCFYHPYTANLSLGWETTDWNLDVRITAPNGTLHDTAYAYELDTVGGTRSLAGEIFFCSSQTTPGTYTITGVLETYEGATDYTPTAQNLAPATFTVSPYVAPTPPPTAPTVPPAPAPAVTYADVKGTIAKQAVTRGVKFTFNAQPLPAGAQIRNQLKWTIIKDGRVSSFTQRPDTKRVKTYTFTRGSGVHKIKVLRNGKVASKVTVRA
jgi:hypothetical protein